jgi:hypothetical protein
VVAVGVRVAVAVLVGVPVVVTVAVAIAVDVEVGVKVAAAVLVAVAVATSGHSQTVLAGANSEGPQVALSENPAFVHASWQSSVVQFGQSPFAVQLIGRPTS